MSSNSGQRSAMVGGCLNQPIHPSPWPPASISGGECDQQLGSTRARRHRVLYWDRAHHYVYRSTRPPSGEPRPCRLALRAPSALGVASGRTRHGAGQGVAGRAVRSGLQVVLERLPVEPVRLGSERRTVHAIDSSTSSACGPTRSGARCWAKATAIGPSGRCRPTSWPR